MKALYLTILKYLFLNDPATHIFFFQHRKFTSVEKMEKLKGLRNFVDMIQNPIQIPLLEKEAMVFDRSGYICKNNEDYVDVISFEFCVGGKFKIDDFIPNDKLILSKSYVQKISQMVANKSRDIESFDTKEELEEFVEE